MLFTDLRKDELLSAAKFYKVEVETDWTKARIATALLDADKTPEQWEKDAEANDVGEGNGTESLQVAESEPAAETEAADKPEEEDEELVLVRFLGANQSYTTGGLTFSRFKPFALMTEEKFESLDRQKFRLASKAEAAEFYGR